MERAIYEPPTDDTHHHALKALMAWVEHGRAPDKIIATKYVNNDDPSQGIAMQRPVCPYPKVADLSRHGQRDRSGKLRL